MKIIRFFLLLVHIGILFLLLGTTLNAYIPPKVFPYTNLLSLGFPILLVVYCILIIFWALFWKKRTFFFLGMLLFLINPMKRWINFSNENKEIPNLKIITLNVKGGNLGKQKVEEFLNKEKADIVLLQEDSGIKFNIENLSLNKVTSILSMYTHYRIVDNKILVEGDRYENNAFITQTDLEIKGKIYRIINCYLQPFKFEKKLVKIDGDTAEDKQTLKYIIRKLIPTFKIHQTQSDIINDAIAQSPYPIIVAGDFNSVPNSYEYYKVNEKLKDAFVEVGKGSGTSFHDYKFPIRIDYIFASESILPITYKVDRKEKISDHYPVIATFKMP